MHRPQPLLIVSIVLLLAYFLATSHYLMWLLPWNTLQASLGFLESGIKNDPVRWVLLQHLQIAVGVAGLTLFGWATSARPVWAILAQLPALARGLWRQIIWAILAGHCAAAFVDTLILVFMPSFESPAIIWRFLAWYGRILPALGLIVCIRLLYGREFWRGDKWLGYIAAGLALFNLAWAILRTSGLVPLLSEIAGNVGGARHLLLRNGPELAYLVATVWSGLSLARPSVPRRLASAGTRTGIAYAILGGLALSAAWDGVTRTWLLQMLPTTLVWTYAAAPLFFTGWATLCVLHALSLTHPATAPAAKVAGATLPHSPGLRIVTASLLRRRFWADLVLSLMLSVGFVLFGFLFARMVPVEVSPFIFPFLLFGVLAGPILILVIGTLRGRVGIAAGAVLLLVGMLGYRFMNLQVAARDAEAAVAQASSLNLLPPARPTKSHDIVLIRDSYFGRRDGAEQGCAAICQQILLNSSYAVAIADDTQKDWRVYRKHTGHEACMAPELVGTYLDLLSTGTPDSCIAMTRQPPGKDALIIDEDLSHNSPVWKDIPREFHGGVDEFYERVDGVETLLARAISGNVQPPLLSGQEATKTPLSMRDFEFYALVLQLPITEHVPYKIEGLAAAVATLESLFDNPVLGTDAREAYRSLAIRTRDAAAADVIKASILRFWASGDPERIKIGLATLYRIRDFDVAFAEPFVVRYMASEDTDIMKAAVAALNAYSHDRIDSIAEVQAGFEFAKLPVGTVVLSERVTAYGDKYNNLMEMLKRMPGSFPEDQRKAAMAQLKSRSDLTPGHSLVLLAVVARGSPEHRQEAVEWIFGLQGEPFERLLTAIRGDADVLAPDLSVKFWSDSEMEELVRRATDVPSERLMAYVESIRFQMTFRDHAGQIEELIQDRVETLYAGSEADRKLAAKLEHFASRLRA